MSRSYEFLKECGVFYILTLDGDKPAGRPFGSVTEIGDKLYFTTSTEKAVYKQVKENPNIQILALKNGTRDWIRISAKAAECKDISIKARLLEMSPYLASRFKTPECEFFGVIEASDREAYLSINDVVEKVD